MSDIIIGVPYTDCQHKSEIPCTREDEAIAIACGIFLGGKKAFVFMQDNGFLLSLDVILSLVVPYDLHFDLLVKERLEPLHHYISGIFGKEICRMVINEADKCYKKHCKKIKR